MPLDFTGQPGIVDVSKVDDMSLTPMLQGISDFFRAHEMSHQWWGHLVGWKSYHDQWMSEGFAQFSGDLYVQLRENTGEFLKRIRLDKQELLNNPFLDMVEPEEEDEDDGETQTEEQTQETEAEKEEKGEIDWEEILLDGFDAGGRREEHEERRAVRLLQNHIEFHL